MKTPVTLCLALIAAAALTAPAPAEPLIKPWGLYVGYIDRTANPGDDFYAYANGGWQDTVQIPADRTYCGAWLDATIRADERLGAIVADLHARTDLTPEETKLRDLYDAYVDTTAIEAKGLAPLKEPLARIAAAKTREDLVRIMADPRLLIGGWWLQQSGPFGIRVWVDPKNPDAYMARIYQSGLGLPDRDYYLKMDDKELAAARDAYRKYLAGTLEATGVRAADAAKRADAIYALEHDMAVAHWPQEESRDPDKIYNPLPIPELEKLAPEYPWAVAFKTAGIPLEARGAARVALAMQKSAFPKIAKIFAATPVSVWRDYLTVRCIHGFAEYLPRRFRDADFAFYGTVLRGQKEQQDRATSGVRLLDDRMGEALGKIYVAKYFPPEAKTKVREMVDNLIAAFDADLDTLSWMTPATREKAREKLHQFIIKVGYPDHWRDYTKLAIDKDDLIGDIQNANVFEWRRFADRIDEPVDRTEWGMTPPTVNAYYEETTNEICFPAGILQPPHFDLDADDAVNYAGVGGTIGHEISHAFDDLGSKYDGKGMLRNWWTDEDRKRFVERTDELVAQYDQYEPLPGLHIKGRLTLGENIGDLSGVEIAHKAYLRSLHGKPAPVLEGLTGDQRFYLSYAQNWRTKARDASIRQRTLSNEHSDSRFRVIGVLRNDDGWYAAFPDVKPGDKYYLAPEKRVRLW